MSMQVRCLICNEILDCNPNETTNLVEHVRKQHPEVKLQPSSTESFHTQDIPEHKEYSKPKLYEPGRQRPPDNKKVIEQQKGSSKPKPVENAGPPDNNQGIQQQQRECSRPNLFKHGLNRLPDIETESSMNSNKFEYIPKGLDSFRSGSDKNQEDIDCTNQNINTDNTHLIKRTDNTDLIKRPITPKRRGPCKFLYCDKPKAQKHKDYVKMSCTSCNKKEGCKCPGRCNGLYHGKQKGQKSPGYFGCLPCSKQKGDKYDLEIKSESSTEKLLNGQETHDESCTTEKLLNGQETHNESGTTKRSSSCCKKPNCSRITGGFISNKSCEYSTGERNEPKSDIDENLKYSTIEASPADYRESFRPSMKLFKQNNHNSIKPQVLCRQKTLNKSAKDIVLNLSKNKKPCSSESSNKSINVKKVPSSSEYFDARPPCICLTDNNVCSCLTKKNKECDCQLYHMKDQIQSPEKVYKAIDHHEEESKLPSDKENSQEDLFTDETPESKDKNYKQTTVKEKVSFRDSNQKLDEEFCILDDYNQKPIYRRKYHIKNPFPFSEQGRDKLYKTSIEKWRPGRGRIACPSCGSIRRPLIKSTLEKTSNTPLGAACIVTCWPFCFLPCLFPPPAKEYLHCSNCNHFLGIYDRKNEIIEPAKDL